MVKNIIESYNGLIWFETLANVGKNEEGTVFYISLPKK
jgi:signal transduction histidine kinase